MAEQEIIQKIIEQTLANQGSGLGVGVGVTTGLQGLLLLGLEIARRTIKEVKDELATIRTAINELNNNQGEQLAGIIPLLEEIIRQGRHQRRFNGWTTNTLKLIFSKLPGTEQILIDPVPAGDDDGH